MIDPQLDQIYQHGNEDDQKRFGEESLFFVLCRHPE